MKQKKPAAGRAKARPKGAADPKQLSLFEALDGRAAPADIKASSRQRRAREAPTSIAPEARRAPILNPREAALFLGVSAATLKAWRAKKIGPSWRRRGARLVFYRLSDLERFLDEGAAKR